MRLRAIERISFQRSEKTNYADFMKRNSLDLKAGEVIMLVSLGGDQILFVYAVADVGKNGTSKKVLRSERLRIWPGTWEPLMLANYADQVGLKLDGIKRFEEYYRKYKDEK